MMLCQSPDFNFELQHRLDFIEALLRGFEAESFARSVVQSSSDGVAAVLREIGHAGALGNVLTDQAVGVFVGTALPRVMRGGEVERDTGRSL